MLDGCANSESHKNIIFIACTNKKDDIDVAFIRRFKQQCLFDIPNKDERERFIRWGLSKRTDYDILTDNQFQKLFDIAEKMSQSDLMVIFKADEYDINKMKFNELVDVFESFKYRNSPNSNQGYIYESVAALDDEEYYPSKSKKKCYE